MKRPAFQFYPADWRKDVELRSCSIAARGLWIDILCIAHECDPYGHLTINGNPMTAAKLSGQVGLTASQCKALLDELIENGVARVNDEGVIYSKRMVEDEDLRNKRAAGGKAGSEHGIKGAAHGSKGGRPRNGRGDGKTPLKTPLGGFEKPPPSSSSSSSTSVNSVTDVTDGSPSSPPAKPPRSADDMAKAELWNAAVSVLSNGGCPSAQARTFMGKLVKDYSFPVVQQAVAAAVAEQPADAREYLKAACQHAAGQRQQVNRQEALEQRNRNVAAAWLQAEGVQ